MYDLVHVGFGGIIKKSNLRISVKSEEQTRQKLYILNRQILHVNCLKPLLPVLLFFFKITDKV